MTYTVRDCQDPVPTTVRIGRLSDAVSWARELHDERPNHWVDVRDDADDLVLCLEPKRVFGKPALHSQLGFE